ncbi:MerR family transcriptional regulator [Cytobacillus sp. FJAT-54145]|uniref:MerR family transcriptional regulator n=1 Tax=Cytobacillus spartinae TaxID=3299023 RepID=A0ABW6K9Z9_9BACI
MTNKTFYTISSVSETLEVSQNTIRNWEKEFEDLHQIQRDKNGTRLYTDEDIRYFQLIDKYRSKGLGIAQIRMFLEEWKEDPEFYARVGGNATLGSMTGTMNEIATEEQLKQLMDMPGVQTLIEEASRRGFQEAVATLEPLVQEMKEKLESMGSESQPKLLESPEFKGLQEELKTLKESTVQQQETNERLLDLLEETRASQDSITQMFRQKSEQEKKGIFARLFNK